MKLRLTCVGGSRPVIRSISEAGTCKLDGGVGSPFLTSRETFFMKDQPVIDQKTRTRGYNDTSDKFIATSSLRFHEERCMDASDKLITIGYYHFGHPDTSFGICVAALVRMLPTSKRIRGETSRPKACLTIFFQYVEL